MNVMKTSLTIIPMCPRERFPLYKSLSRLVLCYKKDWATLLHFIYFCYLLLVTNYLITKLSVTDNFSACREYLAENRLSFPSAPRWVRHSYLSKRATIDPLYLWVIRLQRIYNFLLFHAILYSVLDIIELYYTLLYYFWD